MTTEAPAALQPVDAAEIVDALGLAWATFTLYEDPIGIDSFARAVGALTRCPGYPYLLAVGPECFLEDDEPLPHRREATVRLARRIFGMGVGALELTGPPTGSDLVGAFRVVAAGSDDPNRTLRERGVTRVAFRHRVLGDASHDDTSDSLLSSYVGDPDPFVRDLVADPAADPASVAREFVAEYRRVTGLNDGDDAWASEEIVHAFVDAFWYLPPSHRSAVVEHLLQDPDDASRTFLDQFSGSEIAELDRCLSDGASGHPMLAAYLDAAARHGDHRRDDLDAVGDAVAGSVDALLGAARPATDDEARVVLERLRSSAPDRRDHARASLAMVGGLLALGFDEGDLGRPADLWADRAAAALTARAPALADAWLSLVRTIDEEARPTLLAALDRRLDRDAVDGLVDLLLRDGAAGVTVRLAPLFATDRLVDELGAETERTRRKRLLEAIEHVARAHPAALVPHLEDPRWYLVRNVVKALGRSRRPAVVPHVESLLAHHDDRVQAEALRAIHLLDPSRAIPHLVEAVSHDRQAERAAILLGAIEGPAVDRALDTALGATSDRDASLRIVGALGRRGTAAADASLTRLARRPLALFGTARALRTEARRILEGRR